MSNIFIGRVSLGIGVATLFSLFGIVVGETYLRMKSADSEQKQLIKYTYKWGIHAIACTRHTITQFQYTRTLYMVLKLYTLNDARCTKSPAYSLPAAYLLWTGHSTTFTVLTPSKLYWCIHHRSLT